MEVQNHRPERSCQTDHGLSLTRAALEPLGGGDTIAHLDLSGRPIPCNWGLLQPHESVRIGDAETLAPSRPTERIAA